jgi:hypothetical protein
MTRLYRSMLAAATLASMAGLPACSDGYSGSSAMRSSSTHGGYERCRPGTCGDASNPIAGTNAVVGPGPIGEDWHKEPRE